MRVRMDIETPMPPRVPENLQDLERAIMLLGGLSKGQKLKPASQAQLETLLGAIPSKVLAAEWKRELKALRKDLAANRL